MRKHFIRFIVLAFIVVATAAHAAAADNAPIPREFTESAIPRESTDRFLSRVPDAAGTKLTPQSAPGAPGEFQLREPPAQGSSSILAIPAPPEANSTSKTLTGGGTLERRQVTPPQIIGPWGR